MKHFMIAVTVKIDGTTIPGSAIWYSLNLRGTASSPSTRRSLRLVAASRTPTLFTKDAATKREGTTLSQCRLASNLEIIIQHAPEKSCYTLRMKILACLPIKIPWKVRLPDGETKMQAVTYLPTCRALQFRSSTSRFTTTSSRVRLLL